MRALLWTLAATSLSLSLARLGLAADPVAFQASMNWTEAAQFIQADAAHPLNPQNTAAHLPSAALLSQVEPRFRLLAPSLSAVVRPRILFFYEKIEAADRPPAAKSRSNVKMREAFVQWTASEHVAFALGQQNFSWGASESLTPSNAIFHESVLDRELLYDAPGRHLARLNLSFGRDVSVIFINEFSAMADETFLAERTFRPSSLVKGEVSWDGGSNFVGLVVGEREQEGGPWLGEYFSIALPIAGLSLYGDASHQRGSWAWYPSSMVRTAANGETQTITHFEKLRAHERKVYTLAVFGLRYDFENGASVRGEYIQNDAGYTRHEQRTMLRAFSPPELARTNVLAPEELAANFARAHARGLALPGKRYAFAALSWPQAIGVHDLNLYFRSLISLTDSSTGSYGAAEYAVGDSGTALASLSASRGSREGELRALIKTAYTIGYRHSW